MTLLLAIARWIGAKAIMIIIVALVVTIIAMLTAWWRHEVAKQGRLFALQARLQSVQGELAELRIHQHGLERRLLTLYENKPAKPIPPLDRINIAWRRWQAEVEVLEFALEEKRQLRRRLRGEHQSLTQAAQQTSAEINQYVLAFGETMAAKAWLIIGLVALILVGPLLWSAFWYYLLAPLAERAPPVVLAAAHPTQSCRVNGGRKACSVRLADGETLAARMAWVQQYTAVARKRTRFLWDWTAPGISYASGLAELTAITAGAGNGPAEVVLTSTDDPDSYLTEVTIADHPGLVLHPGLVVGLVGAVRVKTRWRLWNLHSWIAGRVRYIIFHGTGRIYLQGYGGIEDVVLDESGVKIEEALVVGYETSLAFAAARTETFWPFYRDKTSLFDYHFRGRGHVVRQNAVAAHGGRPRNPFMRFIDGLLNVIGKLLGF